MMTGTPALDPYQEGCPTRRILDLIGGRWTVLIVGALDQGTMRFSELLRRVDGISQKMLTQTLRAMERDGLLVRSVTAEVPVKVEYTLSEAGRTLTEPLKALETWSIEHFGGVADAQAEYEARTTVPAG